MFKIESYVTPILLSYVDKYVRDFKPADAQVSLWGGGVALHNLVLKADVLQQEVALPFTLVSGRIHELLIQVPWTKIMSEPIVVTIDTIECVLSLNPPAPPAPPDGTLLAPLPGQSPSRSSQVVEAPPGYMQALVRRIVSNIALRVHHLIVKYVQDDIVLSLNVKHLAVDSAGVNWEPTFADIDQVHPMIRRLVRLDDLTLCLDKSDADGKIRFFQEPLLYRCRLDLRVLTRLLSANTRRATSLDIQLRSGKLAWSVSNDQLVLLIRLLKERPATNSAPSPPKQTVSPAPQHTLLANSAEPTRSESWSEWAWSWLPSLADRERGVEEAPVPATPLPICINAFLDDVSLVFKVMEVEGSNRKRARSILEVSAMHAALKSSICNPTFQRVRFGARELTVRSTGKCVCGFINYNTSKFKPTVFLQKASKSERSLEEWTWPEDVLNEKTVEIGVAVDENYSATPTEQTPEQSTISEGDTGQSSTERTNSEKQIPDKPDRDEVDELWAKMAPLVYVDYVHERSAPNPLTNPYDNPPKDFEYSDWVEECTMSIVVEPMNLRVCMGLIHRLVALTNIYKEQAPQAPDQPKRTLTVEENESLNENLPQRRIKLEVTNLRLRLYPWNHSLSERPMPAVLLLEVELPNSSAIITSPMYPHRVCSAACQLPTDSGSLWQCARRHISVHATAAQFRLANSDGTETRPCARADIKLVTHVLLHKAFFEKRNSTEFAYHLKIKEMSICGSLARLQAALEVPISLFAQHRSVPLRHTTLPQDAINDEDSVAIDITLEDVGIRGWLTDNVNTHLMSMQSAKVTALHEPSKEDGEIRQAWLLSAPDAPSNAPYLRLAVQWCTEPIDTSFDYCGIWTEPLSMSVDPLLISWLAYKATLKPSASRQSKAFKGVSSGQNVNLRRRTTPPSSSGRGGSRTSAAGAELVHLRSRSHGSSSEPSEKREMKIAPVPKPQETWLSADRLTALHHRLRSMLINVELGLALVYVTMSTASAIDCATLRDAMERHAAGSHRVLAICLGRLSMQSNFMSTGLWAQLRHDGPTYVKQKMKEDSFPWKISLSDVSCYTLEVRTVIVGASNLLQAEHTGASAGLKSKLRVPKIAMPRIVLDMVTTTITVSVVTKSLQYKSLSRIESQRVRRERLTTEEKKMKYFSSGKSFKPTTLKEFVRGPSARSNESADKPESPPKPQPVHSADPVVITEGPMVSLGIHLHADTPPIVLRLERDQVLIVDAAIHCITHIVILLNRPMASSSLSNTSVVGSNRSLVKSVSEMEEIPSASEDTSDQSELLTIFDRSIQIHHELKTFFWFQWVVSRVTLVVASETVKLVLDIDDVIGTMDIQPEYNQVKIKVATASIKYFKRDLDDEWTAGVIGGRVLEAREPSNAQEDAHFLSVTITQAQVSDLPASWKEELHPKLLEKTPGVDYMWEVFAKLAPLEAVIQPSIVENLMSLAREMVPRAFCPLSAEVDNSETGWQWPYIYLNAGGIRLLVIGEDAESDTGSDDTIIFSVGQIAINPHPDNPVCRRAVSTGQEGGWMGASGGFEGRQYEFIVKSVSVQSSKFKKITLAEAAGVESKKGTGTENPAVKWTQRIDMPTMVPILHSVELSCIFAPALYIGGLLTCGPVVELNLVSDCSIEFSIAQYLLLRQLSADFLEAMEDIRLDGADVYDKHGVCPYAMFIEPPSTVMMIEDTNMESGFTASDSGVETLTCSFRTKLTDEFQAKKGSVFFLETGDASQFLEVFVTMGVIDLTLYVGDDGSPEVAALRPPAKEVKVTSEAAPTLGMNMAALRQKHEKAQEKTDSLSQDSSHSFKELRREPEHGKQTKMDLTTARQQVQDTLPLLQVTLLQPNVYYWRRKPQKTLQLSLFNAWVALGSNAEGKWHDVLLSTAKGVPDPVTDIPPALATLKVVTPINNGIAPSNLSARGSMRLDIERPVQLKVSTDKLLRVTGIIRLLKRNIVWLGTQTQESHTPFLYELKNKLINDGVENIIINTGQISVCGQEGVLGWDSLSLQVCTTSRPERVDGRGFITALLVTAGPPGETRHVVLHPLMLGIEGEAFWEAWRRAEGGNSAREPTVKISVELDDVTIDLRPSELAALNRLLIGYNELLNKETYSVARPTKIQKTSFKKRTVVATEEERVDLASVESESSQEESPPSPFSTSGIDDSDHFYKDDLRSGAFKILSGGQLPMAYQVMLHGDAVSWRYPHPRAITRVVAFPLPGQDQEIDCVLELYRSMLGSWEPHTYFKLPVGEPRELQLFVTPPETVFAVLWRFRVCSDSEPEPSPYEFVLKKFLPKQDPWATEEPGDSQDMKPSSAVTAEQLSGVLRVDSYFAPRLLPRTKALVRIATLHVNVHNSLPTFTSNASYIEGYYVSKQLMRTHRVVTLAARSTAAHALVGSPAGKLLVVDTKLSCDMVDCSTGTMEEIIEEFRLQSGFSAKESLLTARSRVVTTGILISMQVPKLQTLLSLVTDWSNAYDKYIRVPPSKCETKELDATNKSTQEVTEAAAHALEGRVSLWIHNSCSSAVRLGQEDTDEVVPLGSGGHLAYRWHYPTAQKRLRFALAGSSTDWKWSSSIPFVAGTYRLKFLTQDTENEKQFPMESFLHVTVKETGASRHMYLAGRLVLANMLRRTLLYKVRSRGLETPQWYTVSSGELSFETVGHSVVCGAQCEMVLKIKFRSENTCWSGDIPVKECPKENVPWLVKVPSEGDARFVSVWCRVVRGRGDGRILATVWPLYVLHSYLPLDTDVLIATESQSTNVDSTTSQPVKLPIKQITPGRGTSTHLQVPGTTSARHSLSFQYRNFECPVTREAIPLHYGVTDTSVFDKRSPVTNIDDVIKDIGQWLERSGRQATQSWPYSVVLKHWPGEWQPAILQPRCDVTIRYTAVRVGGGCSLEVQLCPMVLLCNASPVSMTLRSFDAAPLCKLLSGTAISPPTAIIEKPFFMSIELGRETFVSSRLQVSTEDPGRYGTLPPGHVALDHAANFAILCNHKVALLTLYYEIKELINVLGVTSSYVLINRLGTEMLVSAVAVPNDLDDSTMLYPKTFVVVQPNKDSSSSCGTPMCKFWLRGRWRGGDPTELRVFLCFAMPAGPNPTRLAVPIRLGHPPFRRAVALMNSESKSIPIVVSQMKQDGRWVVVVAPDPCPQFMVQNHTRLMMAIAQPIHSPDEPSSSRTEGTPECAGTKWWCMLSAKTAVHYSTPAHSARFPPDAMPPVSVASPILTFATGKDETLLDWCAPVVAADGEQLIQFYGDVTIKLRVRTHPHSTLLELRDVDQNDISASDIRRRLQGFFSQDTQPIQPVVGAPSGILERTEATFELFSENDESPPLATNDFQNEKLYPENTDTTGTSVSDQPGEEMPPKIKRVKESRVPDIYSRIDNASKMLKTVNSAYMYTSQTAFRGDYNDPDLDDLDDSWVGGSERFRCVIAGGAVELAAAADVAPLLALHLDRTALLVISDNKKTKTILSIADAQIDNLQYDSGQYDFAVVASTRAAPLEADRWPPLWNMFAEEDTFAARSSSARLLLKLTHDRWEVVNNKYNELTELEVQVGTLALYLEDAYVKALVDLARLVVPSNRQDMSLIEERSMQRPLRLRLLHVHPLDLTLTLHTAVRMYIALDQSPLRLSAFKLHDMMTSAERLTHALTVHYLSAAILGAGWVVGGLELLGAPGALAARLGGATGGVRGVASAAAAALLRSLSAWAGSLARNLDLLAGDEEHARRAAAARRRPPPSFVAGLVAGITNFAINILGAVGGLAHHPLVGVAVGETESGAAGLRRGLLGALTKPLSATADLVAYAGSGLLQQTGWDPVPEPRCLRFAIEARTTAGWHRDCVRWMFRMSELSAMAGYEVLLDHALLQLLLTHQFLVLADPESELIVEMIDFRFCTLGPYEGQIIKLVVLQRGLANVVESRTVDEDDEYQISAAAMARVALYTGAQGSPHGSKQGEARVLSFLPSPGRSHALHSALAAALHHNSDTHFPML